MPRFLRAALITVTWLAVSACTGVPDGVTPVANFQLDRYLGKWYEIARLDHSFERGLSDVSATYRLRDDGGVEVVNRGHDAAKGIWREAIGRAYFTGPSDIGSLKVSFFGPFYGGYHVAALDQRDYGWSLVAGPSHEYLWILARERRLPPAVRDEIVATAKRLGFATEQLIWVDQGRPDA